MNDEPFTEKQDSMDDSALESLLFDNVIELIRSDVAAKCAKKYEADVAVDADKLLQLVMAAKGAMDRYDNDGDKATCAAVIFVQGYIAALRAVRMERNRLMTKVLVTNDIIRERYPEHSDKCTRILDSAKVLDDAIGEVANRARRGDDEDFSNLQEVVRHGMYALGTPVQRIDDSNYGDKE